MDAVAPCLFVFAKQVLNEDFLTSAGAPKQFPFLFGLLTFNIVKMLAFNCVDSLLCKMFC